MFCHNRPRAGFTLVETLIVVIILGIIAAVVVPGLATAGAESSVATTSADLRAFQRATHIWAVELNGDLPMSNSDYKDGITPFLRPGATDKKPAIGGDFGFHVWGATEHAAIGIWGTTAPDLRVRIDEQVDDGNLDSGLCHQGPNNGLMIITYGDVATFGWP